MHDLDKYLPPTQKKGGEYDQADWNVCNKELSEDEIFIATKDGLPKYIQDELEDKREDYHSIPYKEWCDLLSTTEVKDKRKIAADQIKSIVTYKAQRGNSDRNDSVKVLRKKKVSTGVLTDRKQKGKNTPNHHLSQSQYVL